MLVIVGYLVVLLSVFGGYSLSGGSLYALFQPFEFLIIGGAALGTFIIGNNPKVIKATFKAAFSTLNIFIHQLLKMRNINATCYNQSQMITEKLHDFWLSLN